MSLSFDVVSAVWGIEYSAGIFKESLVARNRVGIGLSCRPARPHRLADSIPGFLNSLKILPLISATQAECTPITVLQTTVQKCTIAHVDTVGYKEMSSIFADQ
jgi:hypothetical protein